MELKFLEIQQFAYDSLSVFQNTGLRMFKPPRFISIAVFQLLTTRTMINLLFIIDKDGIVNKKHVSQGLPVNHAKLFNVFNGFFYLIGPGFRLEISLPGFNGPAHQALLFIDDGKVVVGLLKVGVDGQGLLVE